MVLKGDEVKQESKSSERRNGQWEARGFIEGGFFTDILYVPQTKHVMNKKSADLIERHSK